MKQLLQRIDYRLLIPLALLLGLAPFYPQPHLLEKIRMLLAGTLHRPIDIFDLFLHGTPVMILALKVLVDLSGRKSKKE